MDEASEVRGAAVRPKRVVGLNPEAHRRGRRRKKKKPLLRFLDESHVNAAQVYFVITRIISLPG